MKINWLHCTTRITESSDLISFDVTKDPEEKWIKGFCIVFFILCLRVIRKCKQRIGEQAIKREEVMRSLFPVGLKDNLREDLLQPFWLNGPKPTRLSYKNTNSYIAITKHIIQDTFLIHSLHILITQIRVPIILHWLRSSNIDRPSSKSNRPENHWTFL